nr:hypothetical protein BaRGS_013666 [Batillaria attramentaria]
MSDHCAVAAESLAVSPRSVKTLVIHVTLEMSLERTVDCDLMWLVNHDEKLEIMIHHMTLVMVKMCWLLNNEILQLVNQLVNPEQTLLMVNPEEAFELAGPEYALQAMNKENH